MDDKDPDEETVKRRRANAETSFGCLGEGLGCVLLPSLVLAFLLPLGLMHWM